MRSSLALVALLAACGGPDLVFPEPIDEDLPGFDGRWTALPPLPHPAWGAAATWYQGALWVVGGFDDDRRGTDAVWILRSGAPGWEAGPPLGDELGNHGLVVVGDSLFVLGGQRSELAPALPNVRVHAPGATSWEGRSTAPVSLEGGAFGVAEGRVLVFTAAGDVWAYEPAGRTWTEEGGLLQSHSGASAVRLGSRMYIVGGFRAERHISVWDLQEGAEAVAVGLPEPTFRHGAAALAGRVHVIAGMDGGAGHGRHLVYDPASAAWLEAPQLPSPVAQPAVAGDGAALYVVGGQARFGEGGRAEAFRFDPGGG